jgi:hypothetical protein
MQKQVCGKVNRSDDNGIQMVSSIIFRADLSGGSYQPFCRVKHPGLKELAFVAPE